MTLPFPMALQWALTQNKNTKGAIPVEAEIRYPASVVALLDSGVGP